MPRLGKHMARWGWHMVMCLLPFAAHGITRYTTIHTDFKSLRCVQQDHVDYSIHDQYLKVDNGSTRPVMVLDSSRVKEPSYRYQVRLANRHNNPRSTYAVRDREGNKQRIPSPEWGAVIGDAKGRERVLITLSCSNTNLNDDITDHRFMTVTVVGQSAEGNDTLSRCDISSGVDLYQDLNSIQISVKDGEAAIAVGAHELQQVAVVTIPRWLVVKMGAYVGAGACVDIERSVVSITANPQVRQETPWTVESLSEHFNASNDPLEGFWKYLDRDMEDKWLRLGGRYTIALVAEGDGYDIIYIDGAKTRKSQWNTGLFKGRITKTAFRDNYDLYWVDATFMPITLDAYATVEESVVLTLHFPVYKSSVRFAKVLDLE